MISPLVTTLCAAALVATLGIAPAGCSTAPKSEGAKMDLSSDASSALARFKSADSSLQGTLDTAAGYAILPSVGEGAVGVGGAYGKGEVFEHGEKIGYCDMTQGTIGLQLGGQKYSELIVFSNPDALADFKDGQYSFATNASAVAANSGAAKKVDYNKGVAVFVTGEKGLMAAASVGGQKFRFRPL